MVKADLIKHLESHANLSHEEACDNVEYILTMVKENLEQGNPVLISGFGQWCLRNKTQRTGRNPRTNKEYVVSSRRVVSFQPSPVWLKQINHNKQS